MSKRDQQLAAVRRRLHDLGTDWERWAPVLAADFDAIDAEHARAGGTAKAPAPASKPPMTSLPPTAQQAQQMTAPAKPPPRKRTAK